MKTIAVFNLKGGAGKSTTAHNLAVGLARFHSKRVLLVDMDPQGNTSASFGVPIWDLKKQIKDVLLRRSPMTDVIISVGDGVELAPTNLVLAEEEIPISGLAGREFLLRKGLASVADRYDVTLIDCPPDVGVFSINALMAAQKVLIPVDMSYYGLMGVHGIERTLNLVREHLDHPIEIGGVLATRWDGRNNLSHDVTKKLMEHFGSKLCKTIIPETVRLREAPSFGKSIFDYAPKGQGAKHYRELTDEVAQWE